MLNRTLTQTFQIFNRSTLASFDSTVQSHVAYGMLLWHIYFSEMILKQLQSRNRAPIVHSDVFQADQISNGMYFGLAQ